MKIHIFVFLLKFEVREVIIVDFSHRNGIISLKCEVLEDSIFNSIPKRIDLLPKDIYSQKSSECQSQGSSIVTRSKVKKNQIISESTEEDSPVSEKPQTSRAAAFSNSFDNSNRISRNKSKKSLEAVLSKLSSYSSFQDNKEDLEEMSLEEIYKNAAKNQFKKKLFVFKDTKKLYSERLHFFNSPRIFETTFEEAKKNLIKFDCKICSKSINAYFGSIQNVGTHLLLHEDFILKWLKNFELQNGTKLIDNDTLDLIRAIISANLPLSIIENECFA